MTSSDSYVPLLPPGHTAEARIKDFVSKFYAVSDDPSKNEEWVDYFLPDAVVIIGDKSAKATDEIRQLRQMIQGSADFVMKHGEKQEVSWAGHAILNEVQGILKYRFYQVYLRG
ncbi:hypothetical protein ABKA04_001169 [Annulohypoxylon sp. FPYF3050]